MASYTPPVAHATGDDFSIGDYSALAGNTTFLYQRPYVMAYNSVATSVPSSTLTQITLGGLTASGYGFSVSSNNVVVPLTGVYSVSFGVTFNGEAGSGLDFAQALVEHNGTSVLVGSTVPSYTSFPGSTGSGMVLCTASDTLGLYANQTSGSTLNTFPNATVTYLHVNFGGSQ